MSESPEVKILKVKRGQLKSQLTRFKAFCLNLSGPQDLLQLELRLSKIELLLDEFEDVQSKIELADSVEAQIHERELFENSYFEEVSKARQFILKHKQATADTSRNSEVSNNTSNLSIANVKLPTLHLPTFNGAYDQWLSFYDTFNSLIHTNNSLSDIQKFHYLRSSLKDDAFQVITCLEVSSLNYAVAWELLKERFENKKLMVHNHVKALFDLPYVNKEYHTALRQLLDHILKHLRALKALGQPTESWDVLIIHLITTKLDFHTKREWESLAMKSEIVTIKDITAFLQSRCQLLETLNLGKSSKAQQPQITKLRVNKGTQPQVTYNVTSNTRSCPMCKQSHYVYHCEKFLQLAANCRIQEAKKFKLCLNCLKPEHSRSCNNYGNCRKCGKRHNTLLHIQENVASLPEIQEPGQVTDQPKSVTNHCSQTATISHVLLSTALVNIHNKRGEIHQCRALLDSGSQLCNFLKLETNHIELPVASINQSVTYIKHKTQATIASKFNAFKAKLTFFVVPKITEYLPAINLNISKLHIPDNIQLADPNFYKSSKIDILIGADLFWELLCIGQIKLAHNQPMLQKTHLGWVISGNLTSTSNGNSEKQVCNFITNQALGNQISKFWELEEIHSNNPHYNSEERACEKHFQNTFKREGNGRFVVKLPLKIATEQLGESWNTAVSRLYSVEKKLDKNQALKQQYVDFMEEYEKLGHMELVPSHDQNSVSKINFYLPHHAVVKESSVTTKLRVVFDGSAKTSTGTSLNDVLMVGPTIQDDIFSILLRFRCHKYVLTADIEKMYRQILVNPEDTHLQQIIWRSNSNQPLKTYRLKTVTYGTASAPYLAVRCLRQLAAEEQENYPLAASAALKDFYVDDFISGTNSVKEAIRLRDDLITLLKKGGFELRKWASNNSNCLINLPESTTQSPTLLLDKNNCNKTLGLLWNSNSDYLQYSIKEHDKGQRITKRTVLSNIATIYDPLGILGPVIVTAKILMQQLWKLQLGWDESLPTTLHTTWFQYRTQLPALNTLNVERRVICNNPVNIQLHGFCDSSEVAYGACVYVRSTDSTGKHFTHLLCSKSRVAPLKKITLPRLELCGAVLLAQLLNRVTKVLNQRVNDIYYWSDSTIVLAWIMSESNLYKTFVSNRIAEIQELTTISNWRHVPGNVNPADIVSRGLTPNQLIQSNLWWAGPSWLAENTSKWPSLPQPRTTETEKRSLKITLANIVDLNIFEKFSSFSKLQRVIAYILRFKCNSLNVRELRNTSSLTVNELQKATICLLKLAQSQQFSHEISNLKNKRSVKHNSRLASLNPFLDENGLIRVGGRLRNAKHVQYNQKHPIILPCKHSLTKLIIDHEHVRHLHAGPQALLAALRTEYWPLSGRASIKRVIRNCIRCFKAQPRPTEQMMGDLPEARITPTRPFLTCGVDYAGPFLIKDGTLRTRKIVKAYLCVFVCFSTKAVHLELVSSLTTDAFLSSLKRFIARRGKCLNIYSANATNFKGANNELCELSALLSDKIHQNKVINFLNQDHITWHFIPAKSPHFGGLWEAAVKSTKKHLHRIVGNASLTFEQLYTVLTQIEACLNSRPLTPISSDPNDLTPLTPGHFLIGDSLTAAPEPNLTDIPGTRLSQFQRSQQLVQHFWARWSKEYLCQLQQRTKWMQRNQNQIQPGTMVVLREDNLPPLKWQLGRVLQVHPGADGVIRVATIKVASGVVKRAISKICVLPTES